jgi:hypothetical protein
VVELISGEITLKSVKTLAMVLMTDSQGAIAFAKNPISHSRVKHI